MNKEQYSQYLNHPLWQKKRDEVFLKYGKKCSEPDCNSVRNLEIHHKTYSSDKMPWEYPVENFTVLCEKCHSTHHGYEYSLNKCRKCGREISIRFDYCLTCHNKLIEEKENEKRNLEEKIQNLESLLKETKKDINTDNQNKDNAMNREINHLKKDKINLETTITKLKNSDNLFKDEIKAEIRKIELQIRNMEKSGEKQDDHNENKILINEIAQLRREMNGLKTSLSDAENIKQLNREELSNNKFPKIKSNSLKKGVAVLAAIIAMIWSSKNGHPVKLLLPI